MTKREAVLHIAGTGTGAPYTPAAFFLHFPEEYRSGRAAIDTHVEYFRATGNDIMKVQYEHHFPHLPEIARPEDWRKMPCYGKEFYADQLDVVEGVVKELKDEAVVIVTLYSAFMFAGQTAGEQTVVRHLEEDPEPVSEGLGIIAESMLGFVDGCLERGVDGFYASTQGGEAGRFSNPSIFDDYIRPSEMTVWSEIDSRATLNVLHVCDYVTRYESISRYTDYPGQIVSAPLHMTDTSLTGAEVADMFGRPFLGGMERLGPLSSGSTDEVIAEATRALDEGPDAMILGADCTLSGDADWSRIAAATATAHKRGKTGPA